MKKFGRGSHNYQGEAGRPWVTQHALDPPRCLSLMFRSELRAHNVPFIDQALRYIPNQKVWVGIALRPNKSREPWNGITCFAPAPTVSAQTSPHIRRTNGTKRYTHHQMHSPCQSSAGDHLTSKFRHDPWDDKHRRGPYVSCFSSIAARKRHGVSPKP